MTSLDLHQSFGKALKSKHNVILVGSGEDCIESSLMKSRGKTAGLKHFAISCPMNRTK